MLCRQRVCGTGIVRNGLVCCQLGWSCIAYSGQAEQSAAFIELMGESA